MICLNDDEILMIDGGGEAHPAYGGRPSSSYGGGIGYGGQANGFQPNTAAKGHGLFDGGCSTVVGGAVASVVGGALSRGWAGAMTAAGSSAIGIASACGGHN